MKRNVMSVDDEFEVPDEDDDAAYDEKIDSDNDESVSDTEEPEVGP